MSGWESGFKRGGSLRNSKPKKTRAKVKGIKQLKRDAWDAFSRMIRQRYADPQTGEVQCVTCGAVKNWTEVHAGHFLDGRRNAVLFDERNVHPQCVKCNMFNGGAKVAYYDFMRAKYGQEVIDELKVLDKTDRKFTREELIDMKNKYTMAAGEGNDSTNDPVVF